MRIPREVRQLIAPQQLSGNISMNCGESVHSDLVVLDGVTKSFGNVIAVHPLDLTIRRGEFLAILGPSGCGKTTLLRMIGGFVQPSGGTIMLNGDDVTTVNPEDRPTNMVFQGYGLFPHMTVAQNVGYGLQIKGLPKNEIRARVDETMDLVHLGDFGDRMVNQLSGGQAQRVALARALIMRPEVLLLDEPLAALDLKLRKAMQEELRRIHAATGGTFVFVTHDQEEAMGLANRICVVEAGRIIQDGPPEDIYRFPKSRFVSTFIGEANVLCGRRSNNRARLEGGVEFDDDGSDADIVCVIRPEKMAIAPMDDPDRLNRVDAKVAATLDDAVFLGPYVKYTVRLANGKQLTVDSRDLDLREKLRIGGGVTLGWKWVDQRVLLDQ